MKLEDSPQLTSAEVIDVPDQARFELRVDERLVGILSYQQSCQVRSLMHTVVVEHYGDRGWAAVLVRGALDRSAAEGWTIEPVCTYVQRFLGSNTEYLDLLADQSSSTITGA